MSHVTCHMMCLRDVSHVFDGTTQAWNAAGYASSSQLLLYFLLVPFASLSAFWVHYGTHRGKKFFHSLCRPGTQAGEAPFQQLIATYCILQDALWLENNGLMLYRFICRPGTQAGEAPFQQLIATYCILQDALWLKHNGLMLYRFICRTGTQAGEAPFHQLVAACCRLLTALWLEHNGLML